MHSLVRHELNKRPQFLAPNQISKSFTPEIKQKWGVDELSIYIERESARKLAANMLHLSNFLNGL